MLTWKTSHASSVQDAVTTELLKMKESLYSLACTSLVLMTQVKVVWFSVVWMLMKDCWHSSSVSCVAANQRGLSGPVTGFQHSCTYSKDCSSSAKARRRGSLESAPCGVGIQHPPNSPSGSSEDRRLWECISGSPWSPVFYCAVSSKGISLRWWEKEGKSRKNQVKSWWWETF